MTDGASLRDEQALSYAESTPESASSHPVSLQHADDYSVDTGWAPETLAIRAGQRRSVENEHNDPIHTTSSFVFSSAAEAKAHFVDDAPGNIYSRFTNPTVTSFERRLAVLEGLGFATATGSGMSAIATLCFATLKAGDHVVASAGLFGSTVTLFKSLLGGFGVDVSFVAPSDTDAWREAVNSKTRLMFAETPSNPLCELADIEALAQIARISGARLVIDNCFCTPALQRPADFGADVVVHSATKYLDGQGRCVGGAVVHNDEELDDRLTAVMRCAGPSLSPFNAWVFLNGLETLALRMKAHCANAATLANWLQSQSGVRHVYYPGLDHHPQHALAAKQQSDFGGIVAFEIEGDTSAAWQVVDQTRLLSITANLGDAKSTITHPSTTTHGRLSDNERARAGISNSLLRVSVGLESIDDIQEDLLRGLHQIT